MKTATNERLYLLKIKLMNIEPEIWRRFVVPAAITLDRLHDVIQIVMGWEDYHLHEFVIGCAHRAGRSWIDLYDEMCRTAARRQYRGLGYVELRELGLCLDLDGLDATAALVDDVLGVELAS